MVELILKRYENEVVTYQCWIEGDSNDTFMLSVNVKEKKIVDISVEENGFNTSYITHAYWRILDSLSINKALLLQTRSVWY